MIKFSDHVCRKSRFLETCDSVPCVWCSDTRLVLGRSEPHNILMLVCIFRCDRPTSNESNLSIHIQNIYLCYWYTYKIFIS